MYYKALVTFFNVEFTRCHKKIWFSTGPDHHPTHWKQTTFYLHDYITCKKGEEILGRFKMEHDRSNKKELNIEICVGFEVNYHWLNLFLNFERMRIQGELSKLKEQNKYKIR